MDMIERVARAIEALFERQGRVFDEGQAAELARAAIEAMREPTVAMRKASTFEAAEVDYPRMIDAALSEQP